MATERTAHVTWHGSLLEGAGTVDSVGSGAFAPLDVTWASRSEEATGGKTSPEELIAAAHAACFSMALSHALAQAGTPPDEVKTTATVTFVPGTGITKIVLSTRGDVPGLDDAGFRAAAETAKENCPVSKALAAVPEIVLDTRASIRN
jgi:osmotically inducible protein OsmC